MIFVETADYRLEHLTRDYRDLVAVSRPDNVLIHHFSIGSRASRVAYALPDKMVLVYHNITPPEYFIGVHPVLVQQCFMGRRELRAYVRRVMLALGDSEYNRLELDAAGFSETGVLPVIPELLPPRRPEGPLRRAAVRRCVDEHRVCREGDPEQEDRGPDPDLPRLQDAVQPLLAPAARRDPWPGFDLYFAMLQDLVARLGTPDVFFLGHVRNEELRALYDVVDVFLCASEHEGFCVPLIESFYRRIPVIAYAASAVPATMDGGGLLYTNKDPLEVADLIDSVVQDPELEDRIVRAQDAALDRLRARDFDRTLLGFVEQVLGRPAPEHPVADLWEQYRLVERLSELRRGRPALFQALPAEPAGRAPAADGRGPER